MGNIKISSWRVSKDMFAECGMWFWIIVFFIAIIILFTLMVYEPIMCPNKFYEEIVNVVPDLLGFVITGFSILLGLNGLSLDRLNQTANDGHKPFYVLSAFFSLTCFALLSTLILSITFKNVSIHNPCCEKLCLFITLFFTDISVLSLYNIIFHLFALRTQVSPINKKQ